MRHAPNERRARGATGKEAGHGEDWHCGGGEDPDFQERQQTIGLDWEADLAITAF